MADKGIIPQLCCGCCAALTGIGIAALICVAYMVYYLLTCIFGCIIIYYGVALRKLLLPYSTFIEDSADYLLYSSLCIAVGAMFTVVVILNICAQNANLSKLKMVLSLIIQMAILALGVYSYIWAYPGTAGVERFLSTGFDSALTNYNVTALAWDDLQRDLECCGKLNYISWKNFSKDGFPPISCCRQYVYMDTCSHAVQYDNAGLSAITINVQGCMPKVQVEVVGKMQTVQRMLIPFLIFTAFGLAASLHQAGHKESAIEAKEKVEEKDEDLELGVTSIKEIQPGEDSENENSNNEEDEKNTNTKPV